MMGPLVSVVIPIYNVERYLDECLRSIREQTYSNLQIILIEDFSTDDSMRVLMPHLADSRVRLICHEINRGLSAARNTGIEAATGDYVLFVDSDDVVDAELVEICLDCVVRTGAELVTYGFKAFNDREILHENSSVGSNVSKNSRMLGNDYFELPHFAWLKFINKDLLRSSEMRFPVGLCYEDWPFHWSLGLAAKKICELDENPYHYRQRNTSITGSTGRKLLDLFSVQSIVMKHLQVLASSELNTLLANKLCDSHWSVLTRIDEDLLPIAIVKAKEAGRGMRVNAFLPVLTLRRCLILTVNRLPDAAAIMIVKVLRNFLAGVREIKRNR